MVRATSLFGRSVAYTNDDGDKLTQVVRCGVTIKSFGYDAAGRTTSVVTSAGTTSLTYDYESRVTGITYPNSSTNTFTYNGLDTRVGKVDSAGSTTYKRDGAYVTDPVLSDSTAAFTPGISERRSGASKFYGSDYLGTNSLVTNSSQATTDTKQYDAFGMLVSSTGSTPTPFGFAGGWGYQEDADSGLKLLGHRYYDASTGRFLTKDKAKVERNYYAYAANNPVTIMDANGLQSTKLKKIVIVFGDLVDGGQWWRDIRRYRRPIIDDFEDEYGTGNVSSITPSDVEKFMDIFQKANSQTKIVIVAHGVEGNIILSNGEVVNEDVQGLIIKARGKAKSAPIAELELVYCESLFDDTMNKNWLKIAKRVSGFPSGADIRGYSWGLAWARPKPLKR